MKKITQLLPILILLTFSGTISYAQAPTCDATVPFFVADLRGNPGGSWVSPSLSRSGYCCGASGSTDCASFQLYLDSNTAMVNFEIVSGAVPSGVMYYQIDCGTLVAVGSPICLTGSMHYLTFCKPGNSANTYKVTAIPKPGFPRDDSARIGCSRLLRFQGLNPSTITWTSIYPGAAGTYNSNLVLSDSTHLMYTPTAGAPAYVDYKICGTPYATSCGYLSFCDTIRVTDFTALSGTVTPTSPSFCAGSTGVAITASGSGGAPPYTYIWKNSSGTTVSTSATYTASVAGTYSVEVRDQLYTTALCPGFIRTVSVTTANTPIVNAGADQIKCASSPVTHLSGSVTYATGIWSGGAGTFSGGATSPVNDYTPTAGELATGYVDLILTSTGAGGGCLNMSDTVHITYSPIVNLSTSASAVLCNGGSTGSATAMVSGGYAPFTYSWSTSPVQTTSMATSLTIGTYTVNVTDAHSCTATSIAVITQPAALTTTASTVSNVSCNGGNNGSVTVVPVGGTTPYSYSWSGISAQTGATATGLPAGTYTVTVTDANSCSSTASATVTQPTLLVATASTLTNVTCNGGTDGSASVAASGGMTPYTYSWNSSPAQTTSTATSLPVGTYTVTVTDAQGCFKKATATITQPPILNATASTTAHVSCYGGSNGAAIVNSSGGTTPYSYSWSSSPVQTTSNATGLPAGTYTVTVTDAHGCTKSVSATINQPPALSATATTLSNALCNGINTGSVSVSPSGGSTPYSYSWSTSPVQTAATATGLTAGTYTVNVTDNHGCTATASSTVTQPSTLAATASTIADVSCNGGNNGSVTVSASGGTTPFSYAWNTTPVRTTATITGLVAGTYVVTVTDANGCTITTGTTVTQPTALVAPTSTLSNVSCHGGNNGSVSVAPSGGTLPYSYLWSSSPVQTSATATGLMAGTYTVTVTDGHSCTKTVTAIVTQPAALAATASTLTNVACNGGSNGSVSVSPSGGTSPYSFSWNSTPTQNTATATGLVAGTYVVTVTDAHGCATTATATVTEPSTLAVTASTLTDVACNGGNNGSVTVAPSGGTTPYAYSWSSSPVQTSATATGLPAGTYVVTVTDAHNCTATATAVVTQPTALAAAASTLTNVSCHSGNNGSASVTPGGGTLPYTYSWNSSPVQTSSTVTGLVAGTYTVTVRDAHNCVVTATATITQPTTLNATASTLSNVSCNGGNNGAVSVTPSGGTSPYAVSWNSTPVQTTTTASGLPAGSYIATVTDMNGCTATATATVTQPTALAATATTISNALCNGVNTGAVSVSPSGGTSPYTYTWSTAPVQTSATATGLTAGTYSVVVTDAHNCAVTAASTVTQPSTLAATASTVTDVSCNGGNNGSVTVSASGGTTPYTYSWNTTPVRTTPTISGLVAGTYVVVVKDANNCNVTASAVVTQPDALTVTGSTLANVACNGGSNGSVSVAAAGGTAPYTYNWSTSPMQTTPLATGLPAGTYTVVVTDAHSCSATTTATITQPPALAATASTLANVACNGGNDGSVSVTPSGGTSPYTFSWSTAPIQTGATATGLTAGSYVVTVTDAHNCIATATAIVSQPTALAATANTLTNASCNGANNGSVSVTPSGGTSPYTYSWNTSPVRTTSVATGLPAGTYTVTVTDAHNCSVTASTTVTQPTTLTATASTLADVLCNGGNNGSVTVMPTGGTFPYTYNWNTAPVQTNATATGLVAGTYTATVTDAQGCSTTATATVNQPTSLVATASTLTNVLCNGGHDGSINVIPSGGTAPYTYTWSTAPVQSAATATGLTYGTYMVTVTDAHSCTTTAIASVTEPALLTATAHTISNALCNGINTGSVNVNPSGGTLPYTYSWSTLPVQTVATATGLMAGTYTATVTDAHGCTVTASSTVTQPSTLAITASTLTNVSCNGGSNGSVSVDATGGTTPYIYSWSTTPAQTTPVATGLPAGTYAVTVTDAHNCSVLATAVVTEPTPLTATASTFANVSCKDGNNGTATVVAVGGTPLYKYSWSTIPMQTSSTATGLVAGVYTVTVVDNNGCMTTATTSVTEPTLLTATANTLTNVSCNGGNNGSINVVPGGGTLPYSYSWSTTPGQTAATATGLTAGTYTVTVVDSNGCSTNTNATVSEPEPLNVSASANNILCNGGTATVTVVGAGGTTPYAGVGTYTVGAGTYNYIVTDSNGCIDSAAITVAQPDSISLTANITDASCTDGNTGAATIVAKGGTAPYTYQWDANAANQQTATATDLKKGTYYVTVTDQNGCSKTAVVIVNGEVSSIVINSDVMAPKCFSENSGSVTANVTGGTPPYTYAWSTGSSNMTLDGIGAGEYKVTVTDGVGCSTSATYTVAQPDLMQLGLVPMVYPTGFNVSTYGSSDGQVKAEVGGGSPAYTYLWSTGSTDAILDKVPAGTYSVIVTDQNGCIDTASVVLNQPNVLELPTGFSPNGDGKNDYFVIHGIEAYPNNQLVIFNRWGNEVYSADGYKNQWNGKNMDGKDLPDGTYFVMLSINGGSITRQGYVDLRR